MHAYTYGFCKLYLQRNNGSKYGNYRKTLVTVFLLSFSSFCYQTHSHMSTLLIAPLSFSHCLSSLSFTYSRTILNLLTIDLPFIQSCLVLTFICSSFQLENYIYLIAIYLAAFYITLQPLLHIDGNKVQDKPISAYQIQ